MLKQILLILLFAAATTGCLTIGTVAENIAERKVATNKTIVYSGTRARNPVLPGGFYMGGGPLIVILYLGFALIDPPLSFVLDTALLPATIPWALYETHRAQEFQCDCFDSHDDFVDCQRGGACNNPNQTPLPDGRECHPVQNPARAGPACVLRYRQD